MSQYVWSSGLKEVNLNANCLLLQTSGVRVYETLKLTAVEFK